VRKDNDCDYNTEWAQAMPQPSAAAKAMKRYRDRKKGGVRCFTLYASLRFLDALVEEGFFAGGRHQRSVRHQGCLSAAEFVAQPVTSS
jgi:hypothetical protein